MNFDFLKDMNIGNFNKDEAMNKIGEIGEAIKTNTDLAKYQDLINDFLDLVKDYYNGHYKGIEKYAIYHLRTTNSFVSKFIQAKCFLHHSVENIWRININKGDRRRSGQI